MAAIELDATVVDVPEVVDGQPEVLNGQPEVLNGQPEVLEVIIVNAPKKRSKPKAEKPKKEVLPKCDVPKRNTQVQSIHWMRHVYDMMVEAEVPITREVIDAYNQVIRFLEGYTTIRIRGPSNRLKYTAGIRPQENSWSGIYVRMPYTTTHIQRNAFLKDLAAVYQPLFNMISDKVIPYMKMKSEIENAHNKLELCKREIRATHEHVEKEITRHNEMMKYYSSRLLQLQKEVDGYQKLVDMTP